jgi:hypothetical protein
MSNSDVKVITISDEVALDANGISTVAAVGEDAALVIGGALHSGGTVTNASGRQVTILSAGDDSGISFTVVGTDVNGDALSESVTGANAGTETSSGFFKTITSITAVGDPAGNVTAGINNSAADVIFEGRTRLKGFSIVSGGTAGVIEFKNTSPAGTTLFKARTIGTDNTTLDRTIPEQGVLFDAGVYVTYTVGTIDMMTFFFA